MFGLTRVASLALTYLSLVEATYLPPNKLPGCGQVDVIFTGLPTNHPLVAAQGFNPDMVNASLRQDAASVVKAGYNLRVVLFGPEQPLDVLDQNIRGIDWDVSGVGYGVRGSRIPNVTAQFQKTIQLYRDRIPRAPIIFNYSPNSTLAVLQMNVPLSSNCTNSPGRDLGIKTYCDICSS